ncbi:glycosyltransferase [Vibrio sp. RM-69-4]|uniref:glycosyltransferase family protein n=1 Tax=Vibrio sp. RM-69-4 TaxID=2950157 RepID=UPI00215B866F|nr:glycosyltransferase [Vibrio sp. RM-69-4]MCR9421164.1 glycosyltransferase [Vibrio sp. RM-69-4]
MHIFFVESEKALLPEIKAYKNYFSSKGFICESGLSKKIKNNKNIIVWYFMGFNLFRKKDEIIIHEYTSLSVGRFARLKNHMKKILNCKPDVRIFQNIDVEKEMRFNDDIPSLYRDMAVSEKFFFDKEVIKTYDFVYCGAIDKERRLDLILDKFLIDGDKTILVLGSIPDHYYDKYNQRNINLLGKVKYDDVPNYLKQARIGINIVEDKYPYNFQTSTKILEYLACGLGVYTTKNSWCDKYQKNNKVSFSYFNMDTFNTNVECVIKQEINVPCWEEVIARSKIETYLRRAL